MKVVLLDNIRGLGKVGDVKGVNDGYARNYLFVRGLAKPATSNAQQEAAALMSRKLEASTLARHEVERLASQLQNLVITLYGRANEKGTLFAGVESHHIAEALSTALSAHIGPKSVILSEHLKTVGDHQVYVRIGEQTLPFTVRITAA